MADAPTPDQPRAPTLPASSPALVFTAFGGPEQLNLLDRPLAAPPPGFALVAVQAASVNPSDVKNLAGRMRQTVPPRTPGRDFAGLVVAGPADWLGAEVWGTGGDHGYTRDGSHAAHLAVPVAGLARKPRNLSFAAAAAVGVNYVTAAIGLEDAGLAAGDKLLVIGATGGVGGAVACIAAARGASVVAACRGTAPADAPARHATDRFIEADAAAIAAAGPFDIVYDCVGRPDLTEAGLASLGIRGRLVVIAGTPGEQVRFELIPFYRRECRLIGVDSLKRGAAQCGPMLEALRPGFEAGTLPAPIIAEAHRLADGRAAYTSVARGTRGRVILTID